MDSKAEFGAYQFALGYNTGCDDKSELLAALDRANRLLAELTFTAWIKGDDAASIDMRQRIKGAHEAAAAAIARAEAR